MNIRDVNRAGPNAGRAAPEKKFASRVEISGPVDISNEYVLDEWHTAVH